MIDSHEFRAAKAETIGLLDRANRTFVAAWSELLKAYLGKAPTPEDWTELMDTIHLQAGRSFEAPPQVHFLSSEPYSVTRIYLMAYHTFWGAAETWGDFGGTSPYPKHDPWKPGLSDADIKRMSFENVRDLREQTLASIKLSTTDITETVENDPGH